MDQTARLVSVVARLRLVVETLSEVSTTLLEIERMHLAAKSFDLELQSAKLHQELLEVLCKPLAPPAREHPRNPWDQPDLPF